MKFKLSSDQINKLADIVADLGLITVAAVVLPAILEGNVSILESVIGSLLALLSWTISLVLLKRV